MVIGIDFDGTIADTNTLKAEWIRQRLGLVIPPYLCDHTSCIGAVGRDNYKEMGDWVYGREMTMALSPVPGALEALGRLGRYHKLVVVTARTGERSGFAEEWLAEWEETRGIRVLGTHTSVLTKLQVCGEQGIGALIDDDERHFRDAASSPVISVLFKQDAPEEISYECAGVCRTWAEIADVIESHP